MDEICGFVSYALHLGLFLPSLLSLRTEHGVDMVIIWFYEDAQYISQSPSTVPS